MCTLQWTHIRFLIMSVFAVQWSIDCCPPRQNLTRTCWEMPNFRNMARPLRVGIALPPENYNELPVGTQPSRVNTCRLNTTLFYMLGGWWKQKPIIRKMKKRELSVKLKIMRTETFFDSPPGDGLKYTPWPLLKWRKEDEQWRLSHFSMLIWFWFWKFKGAQSHLRALTCALRQFLLDRVK